MRKKIRCQVIDNLSKEVGVKSDRKPSVCFLCDYLGISRQGYYVHVSHEQETDVLKSSIVHYCMYIRESMPKAGMRLLYELCRRKFKENKFKEKMTIGRDQCYAVFRANGLVQRHRKRPGTTCSNHNYFIYPDLLNTGPKLIAKRFGELCVSDITYVSTDDSEPTSCPIKELTFLL